MIKFDYNFAREIMNYNPKKIEKKWQTYWENHQIFAVDEESKKSKFYALAEFPYPSGDGLHVGHLRSYTAMDIISRFQRMNGFNVLYPMGMDAFGLPTENYALKKNLLPQDVTKKNIAVYVKQLKRAGLSFDWSRFFATSDEDYYRWTQWIFVQMYNQGLAYKAKETINWCTACKIGLANEEVVGGVCERCGGEVVKKEKEQWLLKITKYADRLIKGLEKVDFLPKIKKQQIDWIGRSAGAEMDFQIKGSQEKLKVFTTRPDTLGGVTFMVLAPEHPFLNKGKDKIKNYKEVEKYIGQAKKKSDLERISTSKEKIGVKLEGVEAINPFNQESLPIFVADYVMMNYGTGAIMAVPAHDVRDFVFAKKYGLNIKEVIRPVAGESRQDEEFRETVSAVVQRKSDGKFLLLKWKDFSWVSPVIGGLKEGETPEEAAVREVLEETGYKTRALKKLGGQTEEHFYAENKKVWRYRLDNAILLELINEEVKPQLVSEEEKNRHEVVWLTAEEALKQITHEYNKFGLLRFLERYVYSGVGRAINSGEFDGLTTKDFQAKIIKWLEKNKIGQAAINYKLHDWIFSRQRYWGDPIPMVYCAQCGWQPVKEEDLPVVLPKIKDFKPTEAGDSPLAKLDKWIKTTCPKCQGPARRETDVMPNWAGSNWYFIRYCDPHNNKVLAAKDKIKYWLPVDWYNGGMEHTTLHLLYSRFIFKFLYDLGVIPKEVGDEPYKKRTAQGMILGEGGIKMSKSKGNVINPDSYMEKYGADTVRIYKMFMGPFDQSIAWDDKGVAGAHRFLKKVWGLQNKVSQTGGQEKEISRLLHQTIKKVAADIETMHFNTAISQMMILVNALEKPATVAKSDLEKFILVLAPFAPHLAEEIWQNLGHQGTLAGAAWPKYETATAQVEMITLAIQINGKLRDTIVLPFNTEPSKSLEEKILAQIKIKKSLAGKKLIKFIHIKNKIISLVAK
jgi:leucyl-tRNA synthetase